MGYACARERAPSLTSLNLTVLIRWWSVIHYAPCLLCIRNVTQQRRLAPAAEQNNLFRLHASLCCQRRSPGDEEHFHMDPLLPSQPPRDSLAAYCSLYFHVWVTFFIFRLKMKINCSLLFYVESWGWIYIFFIPGLICMFAHFLWFLRCPRATGRYISVFA